MSTVEKTYQMTPLDDIYIEELFNSRDEMGDISELVESIKQDGVQDPIDLAERPSNAKIPYFLVAGHKRFAAAKEAGLIEIPSLVMPSGWKKGALFKRNLQENVNRENLTPIEEAKGALRLMDGGTDAEVVRQSMGWTKTMMTQRLGLLQLRQKLQDAVHENKITVTQANIIDDLPEERHDRFVDMAQSLTVQRLRNEVDKEVQRLEAVANPEMADDGLNDDEDYEEPEGEGDSMDPTMMSASITRYISDIAVAAYEAESDVSRAVVTAKSIDWTIFPLDDLEAFEGLLQEMTENLQFNGLSEDYFRGPEEKEEEEEEDGEEPDNVIEMGD